MYLLVHIFILNWAAYLMTPAVYVWLDFAHSAAGSRYQYIVAISYICCVQQFEIELNSDSSSLAGKSTGSRLL